MNRIKCFMSDIGAIIAAKFVIILLKRYNNSLEKYRFKTKIDQAAQSRGFNDFKDLVKNADDETIGIDRNSRIDVYLWNLYLEAYELCGWN